MIWVRDSLYLQQINEEHHRKTCNYWYLVTMGATPYTAFTTEQGLLRWMRERDLHLTEPLVPRGQVAYQRIEGRFYDEGTMDVEYFHSLEGEKIKVMDNAEWTMGIAHRHPEDNAVIVTHLNCNIRSRVVYDYFETTKEMR